MTTIKTARDIFYSYHKLPVDTPMPQYVSLEEYEALAIQADHNSDKVQEQKDYIATLKQDYDALKAMAGNMSQDKERDIISRDERIFELQTENEALLRLLRQWVGVGTIEKWAIDTEKLAQLIATTEMALGE